jgi:hypothetical protein
MPMFHQAFIDQYATRKTRWTALVESFLTMPIAERRDFIAELILREEADAVISNPPDGGERKLRLCDIVMHALISAEKPLTSPEIYAAARRVQKGVKKKSLETTVSKMAHGAIIRRSGVNDDGRKLYAVVPQTN